MYKGSYPRKINIKRHERLLIFQLLILFDFLNKLCGNLLFESTFL